MTLTKKFVFWDTRCCSHEKVSQNLLVCHLNGSVENRYPKRSARPCNSLWSYLRGFQGGCSLGDAIILCNLLPKFSTLAWRGAKESHLLERAMPVAFALVLTSATSHSHLYFPCSFPFIFSQKLRFLLSNIFYNFFIICMFEGSLSNA